MMFWFLDNFIFCPLFLSLLCLVLFSLGSFFFLVSFSRSLARSACALCHPRPLFTRSLSRCLSHSLSLSLLSLSPTLPALVFPSSYIPPDTWSDQRGCASTAPGLLQPTPSTMCTVCWGWSTPCTSTAIATAHNAKQGDSIDYVLITIWIKIIACLFIITLIVINFFFFFWNCEEWSWRTFGQEATAIKLLKHTLRWKQLKQLRIINYHQPTFIYTIARFNLIQ